MEDFLIVAGLIFSQLVYGSLSVFFSQLLAMGLNTLFIVVLHNFATFILLTPFAFFFERGKRPSKLSFRLLINFIFLSLGGVTAFQTLMMIGIKKTSPAIASAMPNLVPGLVFVIAGILRLEKVDVKCRYSWAKIVGTLLCLGGALATSILHDHGPAVSHLLDQQQTQASASTDVANEASVLGCMYLLVAVFVLACVLILQAATLMEYPAPLSLCAITSLMGSVFTAALQLAQEHKFDAGSSSLSLSSLFGLALMGGLTNGVCFSIQGWSVKKRGPVLVSVFSPVGTVCSAILSSIILGESLRMGSILGMALIFIGLYLFLWAKKKEGYAVPIDDESDLLESQEVTKPLIS